MPELATPSRSHGLVDILDRVLDKGVVISANITISIADVDLIQLDLRLLISSVTTLAERRKHSVTRGHVPLRLRPRT